MKMLPNFLNIHGRKCKQTFGLLGFDASGSVLTLKELYVCVLEGLMQKTAFLSFFFIPTADTLISRENNNGVYTSCYRMLKFQSSIMMDVTVLS